MISLFVVARIDVVNFVGGGSWQVGAVAEPRGAAKGPMPSFRLGLYYAKRRQAERGFGRISEVRRQRF